jgi:hypothetical protein
LLLIDGMARCKDIESIDRETIRITTDRMRFQYYYTKTMEFPRHEDAEIRSYPSDPLISTPHVVQAYMSRTLVNARSADMREVKVEGKLVKRTPLLLWQHRSGIGGKKLYPALGSERISNIAHAILKACNIDEKVHSLRGAAPSKVVNLGGDERLVLQQARWTSAATFHKSYYRKCVYSNPDPKYKEYPLTYLVRLDAKKLL